MNTKWNPRMLALAELVASWSKDPSTQVGAVIADSAHRIVSLGYNGLPRGVIDGPMSREEKLRCVIHAEENALLFSDRSIVDCTIYVTHPPCARCAAKIIQSGICNVVHAERPLRPDWADDIASARRMFTQALVAVVAVPVVETPREAFMALVDAAPAFLHPDQSKALIVSEDLCVRMGKSLGL